MWTRRSLPLLILLVVISTFFNLRIMYERVVPANEALQRAKATKGNVAAAQEKLRVVVHDELSRALAMEFSTLGLGIAAFVTIKRTESGYRERA
jgi:hypothetical protein